MFQYTLIKKTFHHICLLCYIFLSTLVATAYVYLMFGKIIWWVYTYWLYKLFILGFYILELLVSHYVYLIYLIVNFLGGPDNQHNHGAAKTKIGCLCEEESKEEEAEWQFLHTIISQADHLKRPDRFKSLFIRERGARLRWC